MRRLFVAILCCFLMACAGGSQRASTDQPDMAAGPDDNAMAVIEPDPRPPETAEAIPPPPPPPQSAERDGPEDDTIIPTSSRRPRPSLPRERPALADGQAAEAAEDWINPGKGAFRKPPPMLLGTATRLTFAIGANETAVRAALGNRPATEAADISISPVMQVDLVPDANFDFVARSEAKQDIGADRRATWHWDVTPKTKGKFTLTAKVQVFRNGRPVDAYDSYVDVRVRVGRTAAMKEDIGFLKMIGDELKGLFSSWEGAVVAFGLLVGAVFGVRKIIKNRGATTKP